MRTMADSAKGRASLNEASRKTSSGSAKDIGTAEEYFLDVILQRRAKVMGLFF